MTERGITMIDAIQGPPRWAGPDVLLRQTSFRALTEPRRFRGADGTVSSGTLRVRFGEVEARGVALTPTGRQRYDAALAAVDKIAVAGRRWQDAAAAVWDQYFPCTDAELAAQQLAYYRNGDPTQPIVYEDFLPRSAARIFRSNADADADADADIRSADENDYSMDWLAGAIGHHIHDPYALYEKAGR